MLLSYTEAGGAVVTVLHPPTPPPAHPPLYYSCSPLFLILLFSLFLYRCLILPLSPIYNYFNFLKFQLV